MKTAEQLAEEYKNKIAQRDIYAMGTLSQRELDYLKEGFLAGYQAAAPQWISVKDRLPDYHLDVLFLQKENFLCFVGWRAKKNQWVDSSEMGMHDIVIMEGCSYWMPLPKPPEDK
jgi:hypothetical protein